MRKFGKVLGSLAAVVAVTTVACLPWMLGGVVPVARAVLLIGAVVAGLLSMVSHLLRRRRPDSLPLLAVPLTALAVLGIWQLRPASSQVSFINHSVSDNNEAVVFEGTGPASLCAADTRSCVGTLLAATLLSFVCFDQIRSVRGMAGAVFFLALNGVSLMAVGVGQQLNGTVFPLNDIWSLGGPGPFASFVNQNSAAGWLCLCFGMAYGWAVFHIRAAPGGRHGPMKSAELPLVNRCVQQVFQFFADLDVWRVMPFVAIALLATGVAATRSRGGMLALVVSTVATLAFTSSRRRLPMTAVFVVLCAGSGYALLNWLQLDQGVISEMETLSDLQEAAGSRPRHWADSLHAVLDFPVTGAGLGSYRYATLPYRSQYLPFWFRNADNHYVEMLVEGGLVGLTLFVAVGVCGLITGLGAWKQSRRTHSPNSGLAPLGSRRLLAAIGTAAVLATLSQAISAFFDFGVGMPPAIALFTVLVAASAGVLNRNSAAPSLSATGAIRCSSRMVLMFQICVLCGAAVLIRDQLAAADVDRSVVAGYRLLAKPVTPEKLDGLNAERMRLENRLAFRPDDPEGLRMLSRLVDADFRWQVMLADSGASARTQKQFHQVFEKFTVAALAAVARQQHAGVDQMRAQLLAKLDASGLPDILENIQQRFPLMPNIALARAEVGALLSDDVMLSQQAAAAQFVEPANAETVWRLGALAVRCGQTESGRQFWQRCIQISEEFQPKILADAQLYWSRKELMSLFGPNSYVRCINVAQLSQDRTLTADLFDRAEQLWEEQQSHRTDEVDLLRAMHLKATGRADEAISWLQDCVLLPGQRLAQRRYLARLLEESGLYMDALQEWHAVRSLASGDPQADIAIERLKKLE